MRDGGYGAGYEDAATGGGRGGGGGGAPPPLPRYSRDALANATRAWPWWRSRAFVLKSATDGQSNRVTVWDVRKGSLVNIKYKDRRHPGGTRAGAAAAHAGAGTGDERDAAYTAVLLSSRAERFMNSSTGWGQVAR